MARMYQVEKVNHAFFQKQYDQKSIDSECTAFPATCFIEDGVIVIAMSQTYMQSSRVASLKLQTMMKTGCGLTSGFVYGGLLYLSPSHDELRSQEP